MESYKGGTRRAKGSREREQGRKGRTDGGLRKGGRVKMSLLGGGEQKLVSGKLYY